MHSINNIIKYILIAILTILFIYYNSDILSLFFTSFSLSYILSPLVINRKNKFIKILIILLVNFIIVASIISMLYLLIPTIYNIFNSINNDTLLYKKILNKLNINQDINKIIEKIYPYMIDISATILKYFNASSSIAGRLLLIPILTFYFLNDWANITSSFKKGIFPKYHFLYDKITKSIKLNLTGYIKGQALIALILGIIYIATLYIFSITNWLVIGIVAGFLSLIPFISPLFLFTFLPISYILEYQQNTDLIKLSYLLVILLIIQIIDLSFITPKFIAKYNKLSPLLIIFSLLSGNQLFGFQGIIFAIPFTIIIIDILDIMFTKKYKLAYGRKTTIYKI
ncbi:MAG: AI-2E family transporter [Anaplasmataceae bacterium]|nr:AI-2E family transporter [Anaplasmataceae bacterium]